MAACACMGPAGNCPCQRTACGEKEKITETFIAPRLFDLLPDEDKQIINDLKVKALGLYINTLHTEITNDETAPTPPQE